MDIPTTKATFYRPDSSNRKIVDSEMTLKQTFVLIFLLGTGLIGLVTAGIAEGVKWTSNFTKNYQVEYRKFDFEGPKVTTPKVWISKKPEPQVVVMSPIVIDRLKENLLSDIPEDKKEIAEYIIDKFGDHAQLALSIAKAESHLNCDAIGVNTNGSVDFGVMQINSVHMKKGYRLSELADCKKNVDIAFEIFEQQGFNPWVAYTSGKYLTFYK